MARRVRGRLALTGLVLAAVFVSGSAATTAGTNLASCTFAALKAAVAAGGTITYEQDCPDVKFGSTLKIGSGAVVDIESGGHNVGFDGQDARRLFRVTGAQLTIGGNNMFSGRVEGANGNDGAAGAAGVDGADGSNGADGGPGQNGTAGTSGGNGTDGQPGKRASAGGTAEGGILLIDAGSTVNLDNDALHDSGVLGGNGATAGTAGTPGRAATAGAAAAAATAPIPARRAATAAPAGAAATPATAASADQGAPAVRLAAARSRTPAR